ncbi:hypothetical protein [Actinoplanes sp. NPDC049265]|uniref:hypothetical protein n=1 Tax=Actinoplanes sp. NPDC049265 TaxID=3363902 RepID=UPI003717AE25
MPVLILPATLLAEARVVLLPRRAGNVASARTIERDGGRVESVRAGVCRYWITL